MRGITAHSSTGATKTDIVVPVVRFVVVTVSAPAVVTIIVPGAAAQNNSNLPTLEIITGQFAYSRD